jgi:hypothetical protein
MDFLVACVLSELDGFDGADADAAARVAALTEDLGSLIQERLLQAAVVIAPAS